MTVDEKRKALESYCASIKECESCKLYKEGGVVCGVNIEAEFATVFGDETKEESTPTDNINSPSHYTYGKIECIDFIQDKQLNFCLGNAIKYIVRAGHKHSDSLTDKEKAIEDLKKAKKYLEFEIKERNKSK